MSAEDIHHVQLRKLIETAFASETWVPVYDFPPRPGIAFYSALVPLTAASRLLQIDQWDLHLEDAAPRTVRFGFDSSTVQYRRFGSDAGLEPLAIPRDYLGLRPESVELLEDFRLFHNLYYDTVLQRYVKLSQAGVDQEVARERDGRLEVHRKYLRQYLAIREMALFVFCDAMVVASGPLVNVEPDERRVFVPGDSYVFSISIGGDARRGIASNFRGKCAIWPLSKEQSDCWPFEEQDARKEAFIVDRDMEERDVEMPCSAGDDGGPDGEKRWDYLTPVYFRREVLQKYYNEPSRFSVEDGYLRCRARWGLRMDNQSPEHVMVYLGDLGVELPKEERLYWRSFNVAPDGRKMSQVAFLRNLAAIATDSTNPEFAFKIRLAQLSNSWQSATGWPLFLPSHDGDRGNLSALRIPLTSTQLEFDQQVLLLAKLLVDGLNEAMLEQKAAAVHAERLKGIGKLEHYLKSHHVSADDVSTIVGYMRAIQSLRSSGAAHGKGREFDKTVARLGLQMTAPRSAFAKLLAMGIEVLERLRAVANSSGA